LRFASFALSAVVALALGVVPWRVCLHEGGGPRVFEWPGEHAHHHTADGHCHGGSHGTSHECPCPDAPGEEGCDCAHAPLDAGVPNGAFELLPPSPRGVAEGDPLRILARGPRGEGRADPGGRARLETESVVLIR
jgi:hypothetical protein